MDFPTQPKVIQTEELGTLVRVVTEHFELHPLQQSAAVQGTDWTTLWNTRFRAPELVREGINLVGDFGVTYALSIGETWPGADRATDGVSPLLNNDKCSVNVLAVADGNWLQHKIKPSFAGEVLGARAQFIGKPHNNDPIVLTGFQTRGIIRAVKTIKYRKLLPISSTVGRWVSEGQWKNDMYGKAHIQENLNRHHELIWQTYAGSPVTIDYTAFPLAEGVEYLIMQEMNLAAGTFVASVNGTEVCRASGKMTAANGSVYYYPTILYGDCLASGSEGELLSKNHLVQARLAA